jgi:hypothetical protein
MPTKRAKHHDEGQPRWSERDQRLLTWIADQWIIRLDQLEVLAGRWPEKATKRPGRLGVTTVSDLVRRWRKAGVVESGTLLVRQRPWCWLTPRGQVLLGLNMRNWSPTTRSLRRLEHDYYVNQVRLWLEQRYPQAVWVSERRLQQGWRPTRGNKQPHRPDAEVTYQGQTIAIEVELTAKAREVLREIVEDLAARYPQIWYFVPAAEEEPLRAVLDDLLDATTRQQFVISRLNEAAYRNGA